jgi:hypothetical protein
MTEPVFSMAKERGNTNKIGQLNPTGRYGVSEEVSPLFPIYRYR